MEFDYHLRGQKDLFLSLSFHGLEVHRLVESAPIEIAAETK